jgi:hypothetical protein
LVTRITKYNHDRMTTEIRTIPCPNIARTPVDASYFFGFHDISPWSADDQKLLLHRYRGNPHIFSTNPPSADIVVWDPATDEMNKIGETTTWNLQQGARAQWVPGDNAKVAFNCVVDGLPAAEIVSLDGKVRRTMPFTISAIAPDGSFALSPHFGRLGRYWRAYGYQGFSDVPGLDDLAPSSDGIWRVDIGSRTCSLLISIAALRKYGRQDHETATRFVTHVSFNPSGSRIVFFERQISQDGGLFSRLFTAYSDGSNLAIIAEEKVSHFDWLDDDTLMVWMRTSALPIASLRNRGWLANPMLSPLVKIARRVRGRVKATLLRESYYELNVNYPFVGKPFEATLFCDDGHPQVSPDRRWIVIDTYPNKRGHIPVMLYDRSERQRFDIADIQADPSITDSDYKCDFHPRWNRNGTLIAGDISENGRRSLIIIDARPALAANTL